MSEKVRDDEKWSIWTGLIALAAVALVVGVLAGGAAFFGARVLGLNEASDTSASDAPGESLELPDPTSTESPEGPLVTLPGGGGSAEPTEEPSPTESESESEEPESEIALQAGTAQAAPGEQIDLTGVFPGGEGVTLTVQREVEGAWVQFGEQPVTMTVSGETFSTFVTTSQTGENRFRVIDLEADEASNPVTVTVG